MRRVEFLHLKWQPYPGFCISEIAFGDKKNNLNQLDQVVDQSLCGRLLRIDFILGKCELLTRNGIQNIQVDANTQMIEGSEFLASDILVVGDVVAFLNGKFILLAPNLHSEAGLYSLEQKYQNWEFYKNRIKQFQNLKFEIIQFFNQDGFLQIETPGLVTCPGTEPTLEVFKTELKIGRQTQIKYLPTSPEINLKKALGYGFDRIYEIARCYRNDEITERHQPEFTMLEWYRAYESLDQIKNDVIDLVHYLSHRFQVRAPRKIQVFQVRELFQYFCGFDLMPATTEQELRAVAAQLGVDVHAADSIDDVFFLIFMEKIEAHLDSEDLIFVTHYPPYQAALARLTDDGWGNRFEVYWKGYELANAFYELNDPKIQRLRSQDDLEKKVKNNKSMIQLDEEFFQALEFGMPPSAGIALGVERLAMALFDEKQIKNFKLFSYSYQLIE